MNKHDEHCKAIADRLEAIADGRLYKCPECGEYVEDNALFCECGCQVDLIGDEENDGEPWEPVTMYDYFEDMLDIDFIVTHDKQYKACRIMVAWGGPNIYINTWDKQVELFWWTETGKFYLSGDVCDAIDEWAEECYAVL